MKRKTAKFNRDRLRPKTEGLKKAGANRLLLAR